ncbi:hypothetical protein GCM10008997_38620 [Halomonas salifodinae]
MPDFDLSRMREAVNSGCRVVPAGLTPEQLERWIIVQAKALPRQ